MDKRLLLLVCICLAPQTGWAFDKAEIPAEAPSDAVMASPEDVGQVHDWVRTALLDSTPVTVEPRVKLTVRRQDYNVLRLGQSCMQTPLKIGQQEFARGLGTHANSEIVVTLPAGAKAFQAQVGIDNNYDTRGQHGSVQFSVEIGGKEVLRTPTCKGGQAPVPVRVEIPADAKELVLKVDTTSDGPSHDQSDWADSQLVMADGRIVRLDEPQQFLADQIPFSFQYGGVASAETINAWKRTNESKEEKDCTRHTVTWTDPKTGMAVTALVTAWKRYPAVDWVLSFENRGKQNTPILADIQALDLSLGTTAAKQPVMLHQLVGDVCGEQSFLPQDIAIERRKSHRMAPTGGRSSNGAFPMFNVAYGARGLITAVGWSGQWAASLDRSESGPTRLRAGLEKTHLMLHPGERIRSPRILLMSWQGDRQAAHNRFRRLLLFHYVPKADGRPLALPAFLQCFDRYSWSNPTWATEAGQIEEAAWAAKLGFESLWFDAAWFVGGFPHGVGNWFCKPKEFPRGLKPVAEACHAQGLKFIVWFEPERVAPNTQIAREHPAFVFGGERGGLFKLNDPEARRWLTELLSQRITESGIDWYRNDFNIDPLRFWRANDPPDRQGITEIRYIEGLYEMWDELRARHPGLVIDNCASGGRRIDLEMCMRSVPLWRSDTNCSPGHSDWHQAQTAGLSLYLPLHTACSWQPAAYELRSVGTAGAICQWAYLDKDFPVERARTLLAEAKDNRKYWYGDFYPLTRCSTTPDQWIAYQFHRADLHAGLVLAFRRGASNYPALCVQLQAVDPAARYAVAFIDEAGQTRQETLSGRQLSEDLELRLAKRESSLIVRYRKIP
jgi:alpha-galactosidase